MDNIAEIHEKVYAHLIKNYPDLRFTLRQKNIGSRFEKGYWFSGNDYYLAFSFWQGLDWRNKTPHIFFQIDQNGIASLNFVSYDNPSLTKFFSAVSIALRMTQKTRKKTGEGYEHWIKFYENTHYIDVIDRFLREEKSIIDSLIGISTGIAEYLKPIDKSVFTKNKKRVEGYQKDKDKNKNNQHLYQQDWERTRAIYINSLTIANIGVFQDASIDFTSNTALPMSNVVCFIGKNGTGKTTLLRSIVLAFAGLDNDILSDEALFDTVSLQNMLRIKGIDTINRALLCDKGGVKIAYTTHFTNKTMAISHNRILIESNKRNDITLFESIDTEIDSFTNSIDNKYKTLFLAFPQVQGTASISTVNTELQPNINDAISMLNNQPDNRFYKFARFLVTIKSALNDQIAKKTDAPPEGIFLNAVFEVVSLIADEKITLHTIIYEIGREDNPIWITIGENSSPILLNLSSHGFNSIFGWVGYMMQRLYETTADGDKANFMQTPAIVLIDEIDTFLHISVQQKILAVLVEKFPNVQFIVTTHSPYVLGSIPKDKIKIYVCKKENEGVEVEEFTDFTAYGADIERLSKRIFNTDDRSDDLDDVLEAIDKIIGINDYQSAEIYIAKVRKVLPIFNLFIENLPNNTANTDNLLIAENAIEELKTKIDANDADLLAMQSFINTKRRLRNRRAHETH